MRIYKNFIDEAIRIEKKYYKTGDVDYLEAFKDNLRSGCRECPSEYYPISEIIIGITGAISYRHALDDTPNDIYYQILKDFGYEIVESNNEQNR